MFTVCNKGYGDYYSSDGKRRADVVTACHDCGKVGKKRYIDYYPTDYENRAVWCGECLRTRHPKQGVPFFPTEDGNQKSFLSTEELEWFWKLPED